LRLKQAVSNVGLPTQHTTDSVAGACACAPSAWQQLALVFGNARSVESSLSLSGLESNRFSNLHSFLWRHFFWQRDSTCCAVSAPGIVWGSVTVLAAQIGMKNRSL